LHLPSLALIVKLSVSALLAAVGLFLYEYRWMGRGFCGRWPASNPKSETNSKTETGNSKLETGNRRLTADH
jgi:hypothetical protein